MLNIPYTSLSRNHRSRFFSNALVAFTLTLLTLTLLGIYPTIREDGEILLDEDRLRNNPAMDMLSENNSSVNMLDENNNSSVDMLGKNNSIYDKFLILNWHDELGWNNVRYELEHHLYFARMLNRTLIIPSEVHMRQCYHEAMCSMLGTPIKDSSTGSDIGNNRWKMPIEYFIDLPHLKSKASVLTIREFLHLHHYGSEVARTILDSEDLLEAHITDGANFASSFPNLSYQSGDMFSFLHEQPKGQIVVDDVRPIYQRDPISVTEPLSTTLYAFVDMPHMSVDMDYSYNVRLMPLDHWGTEDSNVTYPYIDHARNHLVMKLREWEQNSDSMLGSFATLKGFMQIWNSEPFSNSTILHFAGYPHKWGWQPLKFTTPESRDLYRTIVYEWMRYSSHVYEVAEYALERLTRMTEGRPFLAYHLRRGDFSVVGWNWQMSDPQYAGNVVERSLEDLNRWYQENRTEEMKPLSSTFFLSTDDTTTEGLTPLYQVGAIRLMDLLSSSSDPEVREFWARYHNLGVFGDWIGLVEQIICSRAWYFVGSSFSSFTGGILNLRGGQGRRWDESSFTEAWFPVK